MTRARFTLLSAILLSAVVSASASEKFEAANLLQTLHKTQDDIARGDTSALAIQSELIELLRASLENPLQKIDDRREWEVVAIGYALDGATPKMARRILATIGPESPLHALASAVSEYSIGNMKIASARFESLNISELDARIAPYVALAIATSNLELDPNKSILNFQKALLLAPGTLVEEVALRRLANLALSQSNSLLFKSSTNLYLRRYQKSPFAPQFYKTLVEGASTHFTEQEGMLVIDNIGKKLKTDQIAVLLSLAERYAVDGKFETVKHISQKYLSKAAIKPNKLQDRINLYKNISNNLDTDSIEAISEIQQIDKDSLSKAELEMLSKIETTDQKISQPLGPEVKNANVEKANSLYQPDAVPPKSLEELDTKATPPEPSLPTDEKANEAASSSPDPLIDEINSSAVKAAQAFEAVDKLIEASKL